MRDSSGERLGKYQLVSRLAVGGMAEIYLARAIERDRDTPEHVVVKVLRPGSAGDPARVRMFLDEARLAVQLHHRNLGQVYDIGEAPGRYYFAMEYLHGHDAREVFEAATGRGQTIPLEHAVAIVAGAAEGLHYAHEKRDSAGRPLELVHRDVSPANIFVTYDGVVKLVDFGLARVTKEAGDTEPGLVHGKSAYMSPEQCQSQPLDRRSDIFSLGTVLYELSTGQRLFRQAPEDSNFVVMDRIVKGQVPRPSAVVAGYPAELEAIVMRALAVDRTGRYATAAEFLRDLQDVARSRRLALSPAGLSRYIKSVLGERPVPWQAPAVLAEDDEDGPQADAFDDEVATSLYSGSIEAIEDIWNKEKKLPSSPSIGEPSSRPSRRLALPLVAEDSDVFQTPLLVQLTAEPPPGELAERHVIVTEADGPPDGSEDSSLDAAEAPSEPELEIVQPEPVEAPVEEAPKERSSGAGLLVVLGLLLVAVGLAIAFVLTR